MSNNYNCSFKGAPVFKVSQYNKGLKKIISSLSATNKNGETVNIIMSQRITNSRVYYNSDIFNENQRFLGYEGLSFNHSSPKKIYGDYITINKENQGSGNAEILRLVSVILMLENKIKELDIYALGKAAGFHRKLGFVPTKKGLNQFLIKATNEENKFYYPQNQLPKIGQMSFPKIIFTNKFKKIKIFNEFFDCVEKNRKSGIPFDLSINCDMKLTQKNIFKYKEYYNELFKKYGIDYEIKGKNIK